MIPQGCTADEIISTLLTIVRLERPHLLQKGIKEVDFTAEKQERETYPSERQNQTTILSCGKEVSTKHIAQINTIISKIVLKHG